MKPESLNIKNVSRNKNPNSPHSSYIAFSIQESFVKLGGQKITLDYLLTRVMSRVLAVCVCVCVCVCVVCVCVCVCVVCVSGPHNNRTYEMWREGQSQCKSTKNP